MLSETDDPRGALRINADAINLILVEEGVANSAYLAVKIANTFDPPDGPNWDAAAAARYYLTMTDESDPALTREAARKAAMCREAAILGMESTAKMCDARASELADMAIHGDVDNARAREGMQAAASRLAIAIRNAAQKMRTPQAEG